MMEFKTSASIRLPLIFALLTLSIYGCSSRPERISTNTGSNVYLANPTQSVSQTAVLGRSVNDPFQLIATDFVSALIQIPGYGPTQSTFEVSGQKSKFAASVANAMVDLGYKVKRIPSRKTGKHVVSSTIIPSDSPRKLKDNYTFIVVVGRVALKRNYTVRSQFVEPTSSLYVRGADPSKISLSDERFIEQH